METGFDYLGFRYLSSHPGRFLSPDPATGSQAIPAGYNPYLYAWNNPLLLHDPSGAISLLPELSVAQAIKTMLGLAMFTGVQQIAARSAAKTEWSGLALSFALGESFHDVFGYGLTISALGSEKYLSDFTFDGPKHHLTATLTLTLGATLSRQQFVDIADSFLNEEFGIPISLKGAAGGVSLKAPNSGFFRNLHGNAFAGGYLLGGGQVVYGLGVAYAPRLFMGYARGNASGLALATTGDLGISVITGITFPIITIAVDGRSPDLAQ